MKARLDRLLVERGLAPTREKAQALIMAGAVLVDGRKAEKSGQPVDAEGRIEILAQPPFVSRGGLKLDAAIAHFGIRVAGRICLDIGASTGGFTDCLLQRGAARVHAVDVGTGQLDWKIRSDPRVVVHEN
jgi:23S rRNA (cytidine1920-2'-O)/16S rRNA (cytidine1409-2'-O)-methyltransferase